MRRVRRFFPLIILAFLISGCVTERPEIRGDSYAHMPVREDPNRTRYHIVAGYAGSVDFLPIDTRYAQGLGYELTLGLGKIPLPKKTSVSYLLSTANSEAWVVDKTKGRITERYSSWLLGRVIVGYNTGWRARSFGPFVPFTGLLVSFPVSVSMERQETISAPKTETSYLGARIGVPLGIEMLMFSSYCSLYLETAVSYALLYQSASKELLHSGYFNICVGVRAHVW